MSGQKKFKIKYELCEIILCKPTEKLKPIGLTVMDGPFFSIMPFGCTGLHSLTSVTFTPHVTSYEELPTFSCQKDWKAGENSCTPGIWEIVLSARINRNPPGCICRSWRINT